ncbi:hypothetical protein AVEN_162231-1 [Araneus ventricosus]|uniref:Uncharacterized protein n=1 Tax=Araneus ventricosus TaxID=182803 RepID=A0A4Y2F1V4_ARAVE|nr:hypothetical protein AVEN_162231-1 [Araneus ventricosus]
MTCPRVGDLVGFKHDQMTRMKIEMVPRSPNYEAKGLETRCQILSAQGENTLIGFGGIRTRMRDPSNPGTFPSDHQDPIPGINCLS